MDLFNLGPRLAQALGLSSPSTTPDAAVRDARASATETSASATEAPAPAAPPHRGSSTLSAVAGIWYQQLQAIGAISPDAPRRSTWNEKQSEVVIRVADENVVGLLREKVDSTLLSELAEELADDLAGQPSRHAASSATSAASDAPPTTPSLTTPSPPSLSSSAAAASTGFAASTGPRGQGAGGRGQGQVAMDQGPSSAFGLSAGPAGQMRSRLDSHLAGLLATTSVPAPPMADGGGYVMAMSLGGDAWATAAHERAPRPLAPVAGAR